MNQVIDVPISTPDTKRKTAHWPVAVFGIVVLMAAQYASFVVLAVQLFVTPIRRATEQTPDAVGLVWQDAQFPSRGGDASIAAWFMPATSDRAIIFVHGKDSCRSCEFRGQALYFANALHVRGFNVLMLDLRGHGQSSNAHVTFGLREKNDVLGAVDWLRELGFKSGKIGVLGISLGSASAIYATAEEPAIGAIVIDSGYADIYSVVRSNAERMGGAPMNIVPAAEVVMKALTGEDVLTAAPINQITRIAPRPIMVIHGGADRLVPLDQAKRNAAAAGVALWIIPNAQHAVTYPTAPREYERRVGEFFDNSLK